MTTIHELTDELMTDRKADEWLRLTDIYIQGYNKSPSQFILPREHAKLKPLIEAYVNDLPGFVRYILAMRDAFLHDTAAYAALHKLYRTISTRLLQQQRRERLNRAVDMAVAKHGSPVAYDDKVRYARKLEQDWGKRRLEYMEQYRKQTFHNRLTTAERSDVLDAFWTMIDNEIAAGDLPPLEGE